MKSKINPKVIPKEHYCKKCIHIKVVTKVDNKTYYICKRLDKRIVDNIFENNICVYHKDINKI